jgi:periplasmic protein TonB
MKTAELPIEEIIFENRNKEYGAYMLRKSYPKSISRALIYSASFMALLLVSPLIYGEFYPKEMEILKNSFHKFTDFTPPPPHEVILPPPPALPPPEMPKVQSTTLKVQ